MRTITFTAVLTLGVALAASGRGDEKGKPDDLPGAKGPVFEYVGKEGTKVTGADVGTKDSPPNSDKPPKTRTLAPGANKLDFGLKFQKKILLTAIAIEVYDKAGKVEVKWSDNVGHIEDLRTGAFYVSMSCNPKGSKFEEGPYQARLKLDGKVVAHINWEVGPSKK